MLKKIGVVTFDSLEGSEKGGTVGGRGEGGAATFKTLCYQSKFSSISSFAERKQLIRMKMEMTNKMTLKCSLLPEDFSVQRSIFYSRSTASDALSQLLVE